MKPPYKYQYKMKDFILRNGSVYLMADCGLGKTRGVIMAIQSLKYRWPHMKAYVFAPVYPCLTTWPDEIKKWTPNLTHIVLHGPNKNHYCSIANGYDVIIIPYSSLAWFFNQCTTKKFKLHKAFVVYDESSMIKASESKRTKMMHKMLPAWSDFKVCLSGTPAPNGLTDLWSQYYLLDKGKRLTQSYYQFRNRYFNYSGAPHFKTEIKYGAEQHIYKAIDDITLRMDSEDYLELPKLITNDIHLELPLKLRDQYEYLEEQFCLEFDKTDDYVLASTVAALSNKLRQFLQGAVYSEEGVQQLHTEKAKMLKNIIAQSAGQPILCAIQFKFEYEIICKVLKSKPPIIYGSTSALQGQAYMRKWNRGEIPLLLCHPQSIGHGVNIQTGGNILVWMALPWSLEVYQQWIHRLVRPGQRHDRVIMHRILMNRTKDVDVASCLSRKNITQEDLYRSMTNR